MFTQRIIRVIYFCIPLFAFGLLASKVSDANLITYYFSAKPEYQAYLEELGQVGQGQSEASRRHWLLKDPEMISKILRVRLAEHFSTEEIAELSEEIMRLSLRHRFPPALILSMIDVESNYNPRAVSNQGAVGLMQLLPSTAQYVAAQHSLPFEGENSLRDPKINLELGLNYMVELRKKFKKPQHYLAAYNIGPAAVSRKLKAGEQLSNEYYNRVMRSFRHYSSAGMSGAL